MNLIIILKYIAIRNIDFSIFTLIMLSKIEKMIKYGFFPKI